MKFKRIEQQYIIDLISYILFNIPFNFNDYKDVELDYKYIAKKVKEQKMDAIVYNAFEALKIDHPIVNFFKKRYVGTTIISINQDLEYQKLIKLFEENNIDYVPLKGTFTKKYYPNSNMRLMGDIDVLIPYDKRKEVRKLLLNNGYSNEKDSGLSSHHELFVHDKYGVFEIHFRLLSKKECKTDYLDEHVWEEINNHHLSIEFNIVYQLAHYLNHFENGGASFKSMLDIALILSKDEIDTEKLQSLLHATGYYNFYNSITQVINSVFKQNVTNFENKLTEEEIVEITDFIFKCGDFGFGEENNFNTTKTINGLSKKKKFGFFSKLGYMISLVCIPYSKFKELSKVVKYCPILLPFGWIVRFFKYAFTYKGRIKEKLKIINHISKDDIKQYELVNKFLNK